MYYLGIPIVFRKCAAIWVNLFPQEEECISSYWRDSKIYTSGSVANSQGMLTEINESGAIAKIRVWVESNAIKHLKVFRIISCEMQILLILFYFYMSWKCFFKSLYPRYTGQLFWKLIAYNQSIFFSITNFKFLREYVLIF